MFLLNLKLCDAIPSDCCKPKRKFDVSNAKFQFKFPKDPDVLKTNEGRNEIIMGSKEVNCPDILLQEQPPKHLSLSYDSCVKFTLTSTTIPQGRALMHGKWFKLLWTMWQTFLRR